MNWDTANGTVWHDLRDNDKWILSIRAMDDLESSNKKDMWRLLINNSIAIKLPDGAPYKYSGTLVATNLEAAKQEAEKVVLMWILDIGVTL